ncbi:antibiotic biosynthesis monooxygenase [soil metagenome]
MTTIEAGAPYTTLINVFTVDPEQAQALADLLASATVDVMQHLDGFISANIHISTDGTRVTNYAQWTDAAALKALQANKTAREHMLKAADPAISFEPHLHGMSSVHRR